MPIGGVPARLVFIGFLHRQHRTFIIGGEQACRRAAGRLLLGQRYVWGAENSATDGALFHGNQPVALIEEQRIILCFVHDSNLFTWRRS